MDAGVFLNLSSVSVCMCMLCFYICKAELSYDKMNLYDKKSVVKCSKPSTKLTSELPISLATS